MKAAVIVCSTLGYHMKKAQEKVHTDYPVIELDSSEHARPEKYWKTAFQKMEALPGEIDTVLLGMGVCGGGAVGKPFPRRAVMPRVDDCVTLLMHTDDRFCYNLKKAGHFYLTEDRNLMSIERMRDDLLLKYGERRTARVMKMWFDGYRSVDMVDTGLYDSHSKEAEERLRREASLIDVPYQHVPGSNHVLEKLLTGRWDEQFIVIEKGQEISEEDFK